ncbi:N-acetylmuramidase family protein [Paraburkholderia jirisanensis]
MTASSKHSPPAPKNPFVKATFLFRDVLQKPIEGLAVQIKPSAGTQAAVAWIITDVNPADVADSGAVMRVSDNASQMPASNEAAPPSAQNIVEVITDKDGVATTIQNAARGQPVDVLVKNRRGEYVWKATVTPQKDISAFTIVSPEYHIEATTRLDSKEALEQNLDLPLVKHGEVMTIERFLKDFGPYVGWSHKVTEQGQVIKDFPVKRKETIENPQNHKKKTHITVEHHYRVIDHGKPRTILLNLLGSRLNYPSPENFSEEQFKNMAKQLDVEVAAIKAIVQQESKGHPFLENGLPPILYERTHFYVLSIKKRIELNKSAAHKDGQSSRKLASGNPYPGYPDLCFPQPGSYGPGGFHQYERLIRATKLDLEVALQACSWGGFQILGENFLKCGCSTIHDFVNKSISGTDGQVAIFVEFMKNTKRKAIHGLRNHDWEMVASSYNGADWEITNPDYANNLKEYYDLFK